MVGTEDIVAEDIVAIGDVAIAEVDRLFRRPLLSRVTRPAGC